MSDSLEQFEWLSLEADSKALERARAFVLGRAEAENLPPQAVFKLELALEEILVNVVHYAYSEGVHGMVDVGLRVERERLCITIRDRGKPFNPLQKETPDLGKSIEEREIGGLGIFLTREMVDDIRYERTEDENITTFCIRRG